MKSQANSIAWFRQFLEQRAIEQSQPFSKKLARFEVKDVVGGSVMVSAELDYDTLPETSMLRLLDDERWTVFVGKRGGIEVKIAPKSCKQFDGKRAFNMRFDLV